MQSKKFNNFRMGKSVLTTLALALVMFSCKQNKNNEVPNFSTNGIYVVNEGQFPSGNGGGISFITKDSLKLTRDIYSAVNTLGLGGQVQSFSIINDKGYICVQSSGKVKVVNIKTFANQGDISTGMNLNPRYFVGISDGIAYLSDWNSNNILVINLNNNTLQSQITSSGTGPDFILPYNGKVYVSYSGGYNSDNKVAVINPNTHTVETTITVGAGANKMVVDANGKIWVICMGEYVPYGTQSLNALQTSGSLHRINPANNSVELSLSFNDYNNTPSGLQTSKDKSKIYYNYSGKLFSMDISASQLPTSPLIIKNFYGISVDPTNGQIVGTDAGSFTSNGKIIRYQPSGIAIDSFTVGVGPSYCVFN